jgi:hypothetical protein
VFALTIVTLVLGFAGGMYVSLRYLPPLAGTREGTIATWTVRLLVACAAAWTAVTIYDMVHEYATLSGPGHVEFLGSSKAGILRDTVQSILQLDGLLIGAAGIIYLLAPAEEAGEREPA